MSLSRPVPVVSCLMLCLAMGVPALAQYNPPLAASARVTSAVQLLDADKRIDIESSSLPGSLSALVVAFDADTAAAGPWPFLFVLPIQPDGSQTISSMFPADTHFDPGTKLYVRNLVLQPDGSIGGTNTTILPLGALPCITFDFDATPGGPLLHGEFVAEQWASVGLHLSADNAQIGHPDKVIAFDSSQPSVVDPDLQTPGSGTNNHTALGMLLIIPQNDVDVVAPFGYVDEPNDENKGGEMYFDFDAPVTLCGMRVVDVDDSDPSSVRFYAGATLLVPDAPIPNLGNNGVSTLSFYMEDVTRMVVRLGGSGGIESFDIVSEECPVTVTDFDSDADGNLMNLPAGLEITNQIAGCVISAHNSHPTHPDRAILFDTANPTGGDSDLATPGYHPTNIIPRGMVLIIAEDDIDVGNDGLVDNPDDEGWGGMLRMVFDEDRHFRSATVLDVDAGETASIKLFDAGGVLLATFPYTPFGDNSVETVVGDVGGVRRLELHTTGSGALADVATCPDHGGPLGL